MGLERCVLPELSLDYYYQRLRRRLEGLTDREYLWEPVPGSWSVRPAGDGRHRIQREEDPSDPPPLTNIAWRMCHIGDLLREERNWHSFGRKPEFRDADIDHPVTATGGIAYIESSYEAWTRLVASLSEDDVWAPNGPEFGPWADTPKLSLIVHILDEFVHHAAEVALLRDLYRAGVDFTD